MADERPKVPQPLGEDLQDRRGGAYDNVAPRPEHPGSEHATAHERAQGAAGIQPEMEPEDESVPSGLRRPRRDPLSPTRGRNEMPDHVPGMNQSVGIAPDLPEDEYFTPEARALCARVKHKSELTDDETVMLAMAAAQAALAKYFHPGARSAEEALIAIGAILDHQDVVAALQRKMRTEINAEEALQRRMDQGEQG
jgi:hypothetical protein